MDNRIYDRPAVSVIIPMSDNARNMKKLLSIAKRIDRDTEVIVVRNGVSSKEAILSNEWGALVISTGLEVDSHEARAIGSAHARGDVVLFIDERVAVPLLYLKKYVTLVKKGSDVIITTCSNRSVSRRGGGSPRSAYCLLNHLLGQKSMGSASFENIPFALSRYALEAIGSKTLINPAVALVQASVLGLKMTTIAPFAPEKQATGTRDIVRKDIRTIYREHAKAIQLLTGGTKLRRGEQDGQRHRDLVHSSNVLHLRSVIHLESRVKEGGGWGGKRKAKYARSHKKKQRREH
ncbi:glycosyltransferase involved in cell wall biosynthesis [Brevibacillus sp. AG162]|uniref:glycosyltransferase n=1 Tax=Brevibacillus sp. AG162 TaxID=2572910 RepID=UPI00115071C3|nr:glycosyltransferase [Brevibacillus sp. AG162]TQK53421.1 glycosyltransferase involved in cell wall biosynthesis [Brevibacillus sp. AG162]